MFNIQLQLLTGEQQNKIKQPVPILGMVQISQTATNQKVHSSKAVNSNHINGFEDGDDSFANELHNNHLDPDKNPIINKRILLGNEEKSQQYNSDNEIEPNDIDGAQIKRAEESQDFANVVNNNDTDQVVVGEVPQGVLSKKDDPAILDKAKPEAVQKQMVEPEPKQRTEGRIVVYGDSNCLDSTHAEKPCFWLLDALLEYTMSSHVSTLLRDLNRSTTMNFASHVELPQRLPNNNLHLYSKVLMSGDSHSYNPKNSNSNSNLKRDIPQCAELKWETPIFLNLTAPNDLQNQNAKDKDDADNDGMGAVNELNPRRKLESQKGEVRSVG